MKWLDLHEALLHEIPWGCYFTSFSETLGQIIFTSSLRNCWKKIVKSRRLWFHEFFRGFGSNHFYKFFSKLLPKKISWNRIDLWFREFFRNFGSNHFYKSFSKLLLKKNSWNRVENFSDTSSESFMFLCRFYYDVITCFSIHSKLVKRQGQKMHC